MHSTTQRNTPQHKHGTNTDKSAFSFVCLVSAKPKIPDKRRRNVRWNNLAFAKGDGNMDGVKWVLHLCRFTLY